MHKDSKICIAGGDTMLETSLARELRSRGYSNLCSLDSAEYVFLVGGKSGGIAANQKYPADLMLDNLRLNATVMQSAYELGARKLLYLASSCCYPKECPQPMRPEYLMTGPLESTNEAYATAKIAGIKLCQAYRQQHGSDFITAIPANIFGPGDDFSPENSHVISGLMRRMHEAKISRKSHIDLWGTGTAEREFIFIDDLAAGCVFLMQNYSDSTPINVGASSQRFTIRHLAQLIKDVTGYQGELRFDASKPDGMPRKLLDSSVLEQMGWKPRSDFHTALSLTYEYFLESEREKTHA